MLFPRLRSEADDEESEPLSLLRLLERERDSAVDEEEDSCLTAARLLALLPLARFTVEWVRTEAELPLNERLFPVERPS